ncbi:unknown [Bacteroides sp. CAG:1076]|nr:unknown [Bacteroides sp. CAG:1076]
MPGPVYTNHITLVLECPCPQQCIPYLPAADRPVGYINRYIIIVPATRPHGKTQVVTNLQKNTKPSIRNNHPPSTGSILLIFPAESKQMPLIVTVYRPVGTDKIKTVVKHSRLLYRKTTSKSALMHFRHPTHPL